MLRFQLFDMKQGHLYYQLIETVQCVLKPWVSHLYIYEKKVAQRLIPKEYHELSSSSLNFRQPAGLAVNYQIGTSRTEYRC